MTGVRPRPVASVGVVCRDLRWDAVHGPAARWAVLLPAMRGLGVDVCLVREASWGARRRVLEQGVVVEEVPLPAVRNAPEGLHDALWAQVAAEAVRDADAWRRLDVVEAPLRAGEGAHLTAVTDALRVLRPDGGPGDRGLRGALAHVCAEDADAVRPLPPVMLTAAAADPGARSVAVVGGPEAGGLAAAVAAARPDLDVVGADPATTADLARLLGRVAVLVVAGPDSASLAATAWCAGVPVVDAGTEDGGDPAVLAMRAAGLRDDDAARRRARERAGHLRREHHPRAVARRVLVEHGALPTRPRAPRPRPLGGMRYAGGVHAALRMDLGGWTVAAPGPCALAAGWREGLGEALDGLPAAAVAGPVGYVLSTDGTSLERCAVADTMPCEILAAGVDARRGIAAADDLRTACAAARRAGGGVWQVPGPWPVPAGPPAPARIPLGPDAIRDVAEGGGPWVVRAWPGEGFHDPEDASPDAPRWMGASGALLARVPRPGRWDLHVRVESLAEARRVTVDAPGLRTAVDVPPGRRALRTVALTLPEGGVRITLTADPPPRSPEELWGIPDPRLLSVRLWWALLERRRT